MITRVLATALAAGFAAGVLIAVLQHFTTTPLILAAELFESQTSEHHSPQNTLAGFGEARLIFVHTGHDEAAGGGDAWAPSDGLERTLYTSTVTVATSVGFAFLLLAGLLIAGDPINARTALGWAAGGFVVTGLAPALGLPPELPGMIAADLVERQVWWIGTAAATAAGLWLMLRSTSFAMIALGLVILTAPHVIGAPHPASGEVSRVPAELAVRFASASLVVHAALWALTGTLVGFIWQRQASSSSVAAEA
jgi:cobalt transporter subunit CbtA